MPPSALSKPRWYPNRLFPAALFFIPSVLQCASQSETLDPHGKLQVYCPGNIKFRGNSSSKLSYRTGSTRITFTRNDGVATLSAPDAISLEITAPRTLELVNLQSPAAIWMSAIWMVHWSARPPAVSPSVA